MDKRQYHYDLLRVFATFSVIVLHSTSKQWYMTDVGSEGWYILNLYECLLRYAVPVFFMLSGVLFLHPQRQISMKKIWTKNIPRLLLAFWGWSCVYTWIHLQRGVIEYKEGSFQLRMLTGNYHQWFVLVLVGLYICIPLFRQIAKEKETLTYFLGVSFLFCLSVNLLLVFEDIAFFVKPLLEMSQFHLVMGYSCYFLLGYYLEHYTPTKKVQVIIHLLSILSIQWTYYGTNILSMVEEEPVSDLYYYLLPATFFISSSVFLFFRNLEGKIPEKWKYAIYELSNLSFGVYLCHDVFLLLLMEDRYWLSWGIPEGISVPFFALVIYGLSALFTYLISWIPVVNRILN